MCNVRSIRTDFGGSFRDRYAELIAGPVAIQLIGVEYFDDGYRLILVPSDEPSSIKVEVTPISRDSRNAVRSRGLRVLIDSPAAYQGQEFRLVPDGGDGYWTLSCRSDTCAECVHERQQCQGNPVCWFCTVELHEAEAIDDPRSCYWCNQDQHNEGRCGNDPTTCITCRTNSQAA